MRTVLVAAIAACVLSRARSTSCDTWYDRTAHSAAFRNAKAYGAKGDGVTDDTQAIQNALTQGRSPHFELGDPAIVYLPPGDYLVRDTLMIWFYTHLVGSSSPDPSCRSRIRLAPGTSGVPYVVSATVNPTGEHVSNFYHQLVNVDIDVGGNDAYGIHWAVAQATAIRNVTVNATGSKGGLFCENGGGGYIGDLTVIGGTNGMYIGGQQWTFERLHISGSTSSCLNILWNWAFAVMDSRFEDCPTGINFASESVSSISVLDSDFENAQVAIATAFESPDSPSTVRGVVLDRVAATNVTIITPAFPGAGPETHQFVDLWRQDYVYHCSVADSKNMTGAGFLDPVRPNASLPSRSRPSMVGLGKDPVNAMSDAGCKGDGKSDDTSCLLQALRDADSRKTFVFLPFGHYRVTSTVMVPAGVSIVGELLSIISVDGSPTTSPFHKEGGAPVPVLDVQGGSTVLVDLSIATMSDAPSAQLVSWAGGEGSGTFDFHTRLYNSVYGQMHFLPGSTGYTSNSWHWTADHNIDTGAEVTVKVARGWLIQGTGVTLYGTAVEHHFLYNYNYSGAKDVVSLMMQTETPYWQSPQSAWGLTVEGGTTNMLSYSSGFYSWFFGGQESVSRVTADTKNVSLFCHNVVGSRQLLTHGHGAISNTSSSAAKTFSSFLTADIDVSC